MLRIQGQTDAGRAVERLGTDDVRLFEASCQPGRELLGYLGPDIRYQGNELVATGAADDIVCTETGPQSLGGNGQQLIAHLVAAPVIDLLEFVEIDEQQ